MAVVALVLALVVWAQFSPRPGALLIRAVFDLGTAEMKEKFEKHRPTGIESTRGISYGQDAAETFDVHRRADATGSQATILWVHGGGWVSGDPSDAEVYFQLLADEGYTVVSIGYSHAPGQQYPTQLQQVDRAISHVLADASALHVDPTRLVLAGDSAGAHLAAQTALVATNPEYAARVGVESALAADALVGTVLHCGPMDPARSMGQSGLSGWFVESLAWAYLGTRDADAAVLAEASITDHATPDFPPTLVSAGNGDPLAPQSEALAARLAELGVATDALFWDGHEPALPHEYQFDLDTDAGQAALARTLAFLAGVAAAQAER